MHPTLIVTRYSFRAVAKMLNVHIATIWRWHLRGVRGQKLPSILVGGRRYIAAPDLENFLSAGNTAQLVDLDEQHRRADDAGNLLDAYGVKKHPIRSNIASA